MEHPSLQTRKASYAVDRLTGTVFRSRDLTLYNRFNYDKLKTTTSLIEVPPMNIESSFRHDSIIFTLLEDDEQCRNIDIPPGRPSDKFVLFTVTGDNIEGLPARAPENLRQAIFKIASIGNNASIQTPPSTLMTQNNESLSSFTVKFDPNNFIQRATVIQCGALGGCFNVFRAWRSFLTQKLA